MRNGTLSIISGPSGAGKGTLVARLLDSVDDAWVSISATTRAPRDGEQDGVHYFFLSADEFRDIIEEGGFLEWACVHDHYYGTLRSRVEEAIQQGKQVILEIDVQGALQIKQQMPEAHLIFIEPPSLEELERRLRGRGTETEQEISTRLHNAEVELSKKKEYDYTLVNDNVVKATEQLVDLINSFAESDERSTFS